MSGVLRYWGFVALGAAIIGWVTGTLTLVLILIFAARGIRVLPASSACVVRGDDAGRADVPQQLDGLAPGLPPAGAQVAEAQDDVRAQEVA
jgi:hypothetical protein